MMDMHGMFYDFPVGFRSGRTGGIRPISSHLRYIPDFCHWEGRLVLAADDTAVVGGNRMAGQSQSNLWFGSLEDVYEFGPRSGWGGPWVADRVRAGELSAPFLVGGFDRVCLHLALGRGKEAEAREGVIHRCTGRFPLKEIPPELARLARVTVARGDYHEPARGYSFEVNVPVTVYIAVDDRPEARLGEGWERTDLRTRWLDYSDAVYRGRFGPGRVEVPGHPLAHKAGDYGLPHMCFVEQERGAAGGLEVSDLPAGRGAEVVYPESPSPREGAPDRPGRRAVVFTIEADAGGRGEWRELASVSVPEGGYRYRVFPEGIDADWVRLRADSDCVATAYFHCTTSWFHDGRAGEALFASLAEADDPRAVGGIVRPAKHNRNLQYLARIPEGDGGVREAYFEIDEKMRFHAPASRADEVKRIAAVEREFELDAASVVMTENGRRYRLPKGDGVFDRTLAAGLPRAIRECQSERFLMNVHGTFYERPKDDGLPQIRPVCTHSKAVMDFCTWRGLLVMSGCRRGARPDGRCFVDEATGAGLWFGMIDELWRLGKPVGRGGPWLETPAEAGVPSDPYLMTGYDRKRLEVTHDAREAVVFTIEVDFDHAGWRRFGELSVGAGERETFEFPQGYSAHWVRLTPSRDCTATAVFTYE
jgi:hypothetical protein